MNIIIHSRHFENGYCTVICTVVTPTGIRSGSERIEVLEGASDETIKQLIAQKFE